VKRAIPFVRFCSDVLRLELSTAWQTLLKVAVDGVEPAQLVVEAERAAAREIYGDVDEVPDLARLTQAWRCGRGSGKTTIAAALGVWALFTSDITASGPGMQRAVVAMAPTRRTARILVSVARELVRGVPDLEKYVDRDGDTADGFSITRDGKRVSFIALPASKGGASLRGYDILMLVLDESEFFESNDEVADTAGYAVSDRDLYAAAKPRLLGPAIFISTPWPSGNLTDELVRTNHGAPTSALAAIGASTLMRPDDTRLAAAVETELARDYENAQREFFCNVTGARNGSRLFDADMVDAAVVEGRPLVVMAEQGARVGAGGDLGLESDSSAISIVGRKDDTFVLLEFDEVRPAKGAPLSPGYVIAQRFVPAMKRHGVKRIMLDSHYRMSAVEHLAAANMRFDDAPAGNHGKYDVYMLTRSLLNSGKLQLPPSPRLIGQLKAVTVKPMAGGIVKITSPRRAGQGHGDIVSALVLAVWAAQKGTSVTRDDSASAPWRAIQYQARGDYMRPLGV
jgi:hypothetical protein